MKLAELRKYKRILILGYGKEGKAAERYLRTYYPECAIGIADKEDGEEYLQKQYEYDLVIKTPGIPKQLVKVPYTTATNIFFANKGDHIVIGVTGSKGKSTTASLIHHLLYSAGIPSCLVGNIGNPALEELLKSTSGRTYFVYELSSYQLDDIHYSPHISLVVSLFPEHMNYHGGEEAYYEAKHNIIKHATKEDYYIYNADYPLLKEWATQTSAQTMPFETDFVPREISLLGEHNKSNIRGAITVARLLHIDDSLTESAVRSFRPLPHRLQHVGMYKGISFYDDAISTTPESTIAALDSLKKVKTIFLGGEDRGYDYHNLAIKLKEYEVANIVLFPDSGDKIKEALHATYETLPRIRETNQMQEAVSFAFETTPPGSICLLSTASPSYSLWKNFEEKGDQYQLFVRKLGHE